MKFKSLHNNGSFCKYISVDSMHVSNWALSHTPQKFMALNFSLLFHRDSLSEIKESVFMAGSPGQARS